MLLNVCATFALLILNGKEKERGRYKESEQVGKTNAKLHTWHGYS